MTETKNTTMTTNVKDFQGVYFRAMAMEGDIRCPKCNKPAVMKPTDDINVARVYCEDCGWTDIVCPEKFAMPTK